jgi:hypothetical protein
VLCLANSVFKVKTVYRYIDNIVLGFTLLFAFILMLVLLGRISKKAGKMSNEQNSDNSMSG